MDLSKVSVVLPSLDPDEKLGRVITGLLDVGFTDIILVNDGSKPEKLPLFTAAAQHPQVHLLHHEENRGKGAALKTAFRWFLENRPDGLGVVTVDGDDQHHPEDTRACVENMLKTGHLTLGVRDFDQPHVPFKSRNGNKITSFVFKLFVGMTISDTQTGLRAIPRTALPTLTAIAGDRFEYETNMLLAMKTEAIPFDEVKIRTVYIDENKSSHFRAFRDSWRIYKLILAHFFRYTGSSLVCALMDVALYDLLIGWLEDPFFGLTLTAAATVTARAVSSLLNFTLNRHVVFHSKVSLWTALKRYYLLAIPVAIAQLLLTHLINSLLHTGVGTVPGTAVYACVMTALYFITFMVQQRWVFAKNKED